MLLKRLTLLLFVFFAAVAEARLRPEPGQFGFEEEWVYFNPSFDYPFTLFAGSFNSQTVEGVVKTDTSIGSALANSFDYQSGFRVGGAYAFCECCLDVHVRYTRLLLRNSRPIKGYAAMALLNNLGQLGFLDIPLLIAAIANQENTFDYHDVDSYFGKSVCSGVHLDLAFLAGLRYAQVDLRYETTYARLEQPQGRAPRRLDVFEKNTLCFWGVGPEMGLDAGYSLGCGFSFAGRVETAVLISRLKGKQFIRLIREVFPGGNLLEISDIDLDPTWRLVPVYDFRVGLAYEWCCRWLTLSIEGGYEALSYARALPIFEIGKRNATTLYEYSNADLHGPYINVAIRF